MFELDAAVIGAGAVGLGIAKALAEAGREVVILEKNRHFGEETSSRNSEVIHAGLYYEPGSLKGRMCVAGRDRIYAWCAARGVTAKRLGKLIVATAEAEEPALETVMARAAGNGVTELHPISGAAAREMEPALTATAALWSPLTGVVDSHGYMLAMLGAAEDAGAMLSLSAPVLRGETRVDGRIDLEVGGAQPARLRCRLVVNAAGLWAQKVAASIEGLPSQARAPQVLTKGNYFALTGVRTPFSRLIYPAPVAGGLGVHVTIDLAGAARFGPDVEQLPSHDPADIDYSVDPKRGDAFYAAIRRYWPALPDGALRPDYAGVRPKIDQDYQTDFRIDGPETHGVPGLINLFGIESPGLTGALPLGEHVAALAAEAA
ncbi:MAG: NAD(P)/FAD-dependent oxidoreductase [Pseudomonadota bacterium]